MKADSIYRRLVRSLSISITSVTIGILLLTDLAVDSWVHDEFDRAMHNKAILLTTLVDEDAQSIEFDFAGEFMPEFEGEADPEYYQLWRGEETFERSDTLDIFAINSLPYQTVALGSELSIDITLPDGRDGRVLYYRFLPQVDSDDRQEYNAMVAATGKQQQPMLLAYAISTEKLNFLTWMIDISFIVAAILVVLIIRFLVKHAVSSGLKPLDEFTKNLKSISVADKHAELRFSTQVDELLPIQTSINTFIEENRALYLKEQRLTSDIAHELKTPIAELINLSEVSIKFPDDKNLNASFKPDVLDISLRLQKVVDSILLFHRYSNETFDKNDVFDPYQVIGRLTANCSRVSIHVEGESNPLASNLFAFECIFNNLIKNANTYSPTGSNIDITIRSGKLNRTEICIRNQCQTPLLDEDINAMFDPLWQKDAARTSTMNFGLGLSIVKTFVLALNGDIEVATHNEEIIFIVSLPS